MQKGDANFCHSLLTSVTLSVDFLAYLAAASDCATGTATAITTSLLYSSLSSLSTER